MCTDSGSEQVAVEAMKAGLSDYVFKGRHFKRLAGAVGESLKKQQLRENYAKTSAQLAISEERLRLAIEASKMGTWDWNLLNGEVVWSEGHELLLGLEKGSFAGTYEAFFACIHPDDQASIARAVAFALENKIEYQYEFRVVSPTAACTGSRVGASFLMMIRVNRCDRSAWFGILPIANYRKRGCKKARKICALL